MAARKNKGTKDKPWPEKVRDRIQTSMLLNRLESHILGKVDMSQTQMRAAEILLRKSLPDLSSVQLTGDEDNPLDVKHTHRIELVAPDAH